MRLDLYQSETARIAAEQAALLYEAYRRRRAGQKAYRRWSKTACDMPGKC